MTKQQAYRILSERAADFILDGGNPRTLAGNDRTKVLELAKALEVLGFQDEADRCREYGLNMEE
jgi:hypothetical protein